MSVFGKLFGAGGGKAGKGGPTPQEAIQRLRDTEEMLSKKQEFLEKKIEQELTAAKKHGTKNKRAALQALKRKKRYEKQLAQIDGTLSTIEFQREALENANTNTEVLKNMGYAAKAMKAAHDNMDIDKVDELMQDIADQQELAEEISTAISKPVGFGEEFDEDELMAELEELEQEELDKNLLEISGPETVPLPNVPSIAIPSKPSEYFLSRVRHTLGAVWRVFLWSVTRLRSRWHLLRRPQRQCHLPFPSFSLEQGFLTLALLTWPDPLQPVLCPVDLEEHP
ncbi:charged multivesicular body protein 4B [Phyllostomus discolor]|uniref:Charged multivesicular body protein 4B n=1 Tax=Phyllostomus discolor TaxID=89673 RepID=A0A833Z7N6_9CHIR|nr:charged multivesicular body protein 4B [Phyllostomus discolor]